MGITNPNAIVAEEAEDLRIYTSTPVGHFWKKGEVWFYRSAFSGITIKVFPHNRATFIPTNKRLICEITEKEGYQFTEQKLNEYMEEIPFSGKKRATKQ